MATVHLIARNRDYQFTVQAHEPVLFAGMRQGLELPYACATGTCGTCRARIAAGEATSAWSEPPGLPRSASRYDVLLCQCIPATDLVVEIGANVLSRSLGSHIPQHYSASLHSFDDLAPGVAAFTCDLECPMNFEAGQFALLSAPGISGYRAYSMARFAKSDKRLHFLIKRKPDGAFSTWLFTQTPFGAPIKVFGPLGRATFEPQCAKNLLIIAGGSGIAGMMAILQRALETLYFSAFRANVFFGIRTWADAFMLEDLSQLATMHPDHVTITIALSDGDVPGCAFGAFPALRFARGQVHEVARDVMKGQCANTRAYVAGPPPSVDAALRYLIREARFPPAEIRYDKFS
jgi:toluene monooxygenase electron transfer component